MKKKQEQVVLDFFNLVGDQENLHALFEDAFHSNTIQVGSFGNKVGIDEIKAYYYFRDELFSSADLKFFKLQSYQNFVDFDLLFYDYHDRELSSQTKDLALSAHTSPFINLMATTPPTGIKTEIRMQGTFIFHKGKVSYFNLNGDTDRFIQQLFPNLALSKESPPKLTFIDLIHFIQHRSLLELTPQEIASLAFSMGGFNPKQSSVYLSDTPAKIKELLTSGCHKLRCATAVECSEKMTQEGTAPFFKQLCQRLIVSPLCKN